MARNGSPSLTADPLLEEAAAAVTRRFGCGGVRPAAWMGIL
jgi:hypothetical protein